MDFYIIYLLFLLCIGPFHLLCWVIRYFKIRHKPLTAYKRSLYTYIVAVLVWSLGFGGMCYLFSLYNHWELTLLCYIGTAGVFPLYYWKNIARVSYDNRENA